jgi:hypothetical protein
VLRERPRLARNGDTPPPPETPWSSTRDLRLLYFCTSAGKGVSWVANPSSLAPDSAAF